MGIKEIDWTDPRYSNLIVILVALLAFLAGCLIEYLSGPQIDSPADTISLQAEPSGGLDASAINRVTISMYQSSDSNENTTSNATATGQTECSICLSPFEDGEILKIMPKCGHVFHCVCVDRWLSRQHTCPLCRKAIVSSSASGSVNDVEGHEN